MKLELNHIILVKKMENIIFDAQKVGNNIILKIYYNNIIIF